MKHKQEVFRFALLGGGLALIFLIFVYQLVFIQISQGETYKKKVTQGYSRTQTVMAARGEIVDRYGRPFTTNRIGLDVILDQAYLPVDNLGKNKVILELITLMESMGQGWIDNLPISPGAPDGSGTVHFEFLPNKEAEVARLKSDLNIAPSATADDCMYWLASDRYYYLSSWEKEPLTQRKLAGVRYEMAQQNFGYKNNYTFAKDVGSTVATNIQERGYAMPGVDVLQSTVREYTNGTLAPHIIGNTGPIYQEDKERLQSPQVNQWWSEENPQGYRGTDILGKSGIEATYENLLRGKNGERKITLNAQHQVVNVEETVPPTPGNTVVLTLDKDLQQVAQDSLAGHILDMQQNAVDVAHGKNSTAGSAVCTDVKTGEILAMATYPSYDASTYYQDFEELKKQVPEPLLNRATGGVYRPGSTYKPVVAVAGLSEGKITPEEKILCEGTYNRFAPSYTPHCLYVNGPIDVRHALAVSCNIFFYETGWRLGIAKQNEYAAHFGLGQKTGIEIPEAKGTLSSPITREMAGDQWTNGSVIQSAIGQLDHGFTPVQMAGYVSTLANDGKRMQLHLVKSVKSYDFQTTVEEKAPAVIDQVPATPQTFQVVREGMIAATQAGGTSGWLWTGFPLTVASKTGTPETLTNLTSTYICYIPAENPEIAITVVVENGGQGYTGAPIARDIAQQYFFGRTDTPGVLSPGQLLP